MLRQELRRDVDARSALLLSRGPGGLPRSRSRLVPLVAATDVSIEGPGAHARAFFIRIHDDQRRRNDMRFTIDTPGIGSADGRLVTRGERRLMRAVLEDALRTLLGARLGRSSDRWVRQELAWITSLDHSDPFTFERICEALAIDAGWLRRRVLDAYWGIGARRLARVRPERQKRVAAAQ
jgi:hypothetical protein